MAQFIKDPANTAVGSTPADIAALWNAALSGVTVQNDGTDNYFEVDPSGGVSREGWYWTDIADATVVEVHALLAINVQDGSYQASPAMMVRADSSAPTGSETLVAGSVREADSELRGFQYDGGNYTEIGNSVFSVADEVKFHVITSVDASNNLTVKAWEDGASEPTSPQISGTTDITTAGRVGFFSFRDTSFRVYHYGVGTDGDAAPAPGDTITNDPPQGTVTIDAAGITTTDTTATVPFSYSDTDADGYEYRIDGGTAIDAGLPDPLEVNPTGLTESTTYQIEVRAYNSEGSSAWSASESFTTDAAPQDVKVRVRLVDPAGGYRTGLSGLGYAIRTARPGQAGALVKEAGDGTTDVDGYFEYTLTQTEKDDAGLSSGSVVWLEVTSSDGTPNTNSWSIAHPVALESA